jgi:hypothetical protein
MRNSTNNLRTSKPNVPSKLVNILNSLSNMFSFGFGLLLFIIGLSYLSIFSYKYSLNTFSVDLMAGCFLTSGLVVGALSIVRVFFKDQKNQLALTLSLAIVLLVLFLIYFLLGIIGLSMNGSDSFANEARQKMLRSMKAYDELNIQKKDTKKINW